MVVFDKLITFQKLNQENESWQDYFKCHAHINKSGGGEYSASGSDRSRLTLVFQVHNLSLLHKIRFNTQLYRIVYNGHNFNIIDTDLYNEDSRNVLKITGEGYGD